MNDNQSSALVLRPCKSIDEVKQALALARTVFLSQESDHSKLEEKNVQWLDFPGFVPQDVIVLLDDTAIIGCIRLQFRRLRMRNGSFLAANLTAICIDESYRGKGNSKALIESTLDYARSRGAEIAYLFGRRAVDHFYLQFGFEGISTYDKIHISGFSNSESCSWDEVDLKDLDILMNLHRESYGMLSGYMERDLDFWKFSFRRSKISNCFKLLISKKHTAYACLADNRIAEFAISGSNLIGALNELSQSGAMILEASPEHPCVEKIISSGLDITLSHRKCHFGGHLVKSLIPDVKFKHDWQSFNISFLDQL